MKTRNRILSIFLAVLMVVSAIPFAFANDGVEIGGQCGENAYWKLDDQGKLTIFGSGEIQKYEYSYNDEGELCTGSIYQDDWWDFDFQIQSVVIQEGITSICCRAFQYCNNLTKVILPDSLERIDAEAFYWCNSLHELLIPKSVTNIAEDAFAKCNLCEITVDPENPNYMNDEMGVLFNRAQTILLRYPSESENESYTIPNTVKSIAPFAFRSSYNLCSLTIPDSVETIGEESFSGLYQVTDLTFSKNVSVIPTDAFRGCRVETLNIPEGVTIIQKSAFAYGRIQNVNIPASVSFIGNGAFAGNSSLLGINVAAENENYVSSEDGVLFTKDGATLLQYPCGSEATSYTVPNGTKTIAPYAFAQSNQLESVVFPETSLEAIEREAFSGCESLCSVEIPGSVKEITAYSFAHCYALTDITIPSGVERIEYSAFRADVGLKTVSFPDTFISIEHEVFLGCKQLDSFVVDENNPYYSSDENGLLLNKDKSVLIMLPEGKSWKEFIVPETVRKINNQAIRNENLESIVFPDGLEEIDRNAIVNCPALKEIVFSEGWLYLSDGFVWNCPQLERVDLPYGLMCVDSYAFDDCDNLSDIYFNGTEAEWNDIQDYSHFPIVLGTATLHFKNCAHENIRDIPAVESLSCTQPGNTEGKRCADCGRWLKESKKVVKAHTDENEDSLCDLCERPVSEIRVGEVKDFVLNAGSEKSYCFVPEEDGYYDVEIVYRESYVEPYLHYHQSGPVGLGMLRAGEAYDCGAFSFPFSPEQVAVSLRVVQKNSCGKYISWSLSEAPEAGENAKCLRITGLGDMWDYSEEPAPWGDPTIIREVIFNSNSVKGSIRSISPEAFAGMTNVKMIYNFHENLVVSSVFKDIATDFTVCCPEGTAEYRYCMENGIPWVSAGGSGDIPHETESLTDEDTGVEIAFYPDTFDDEDVTLAVKTIDTQNENARAWSIAPVNDQGEKVQPNQRVQIRLPLPEGWNRMPLLITHTHDDGEVEIISGNNYWFEGDYVVFWVSRFSKFEVTALENIPEPHTHTYISSVTIQPTCTSAGLRTYTCTSCEAGTIGHTYSEPIGAVGHVYGSWTIIKEPSCKEAGMEMHVCVNCLDQRESHSLNALGHIDRDGDGYCDREGCGEMMTGGDLCPQCGKVHKGFFQKIVGFFHKIIYRLTHLFEK